MATYKLSIELGWIYKSADGSLEITQKMNIDAAPTDKIKVTTGNIIDQRVAVTLQIADTGSTVRPVENSVIHYQTITPGLTDIEQIRNDINLIDEIFISTSYVGADGKRSTSINVTNSDCEIVTV